MYVVKINGKRHEVSYIDGEKVYDPPLDDARLKKDRQNIKDICKHQKCPGLRTDTNWMAGRGTLLDQMEGDETYTKILVDKARKQGYNPGANDVYIGQMADKTGDPKAWFKPSEGRAELIRRAKAAGKGIEAPGISVAPKPYVEKDRPALNPKFTKKLFNHYRSTGEHASMNDKELVKHIENHHGRPVKK